MIAKSLFADSPSLIEHYVIVPVAMLAAALPITFAGIGVLEAAFESLYVWVPSVPTEASGFLVALVFEIVRLVIAVIGTVFYWTANAEVRESLIASEDLAKQPAGKNTGDADSPPTKTEKSDADDVGSDADIAADPCPE